MCTLGNFHLQLAVKWTHIYIIVTIPSKLQLVKKWVLFDYGKGIKYKNAFSELFIFFFFFVFFWLNSRISLTGVHPHMKLGGDIDFGDAQGIGLLGKHLTFWKTTINNFGPYITIGHASLCNSLTIMLGCMKLGKQVGNIDTTPTF